MALASLQGAVLSAMSSVLTVKISIESPAWVSSRDQQLVHATADEEHKVQQQQGRHDTARVCSYKEAQEYAKLLEKSLAATQQQLERAQQDCQGWQNKFHKKEAECLRLHHQVKDLQAHQKAAALDEFVQLEALLESQEQQSVAAQSALSEIQQQRDQVAIVNTVLSRKLVDASCRSAEYQANALTLAEELNKLRSHCTPQQQQAPSTAHMQQSRTPNASQGTPLQPLTPEDSTADSLQQHSVQECDVAVCVEDQAPAAAQTTAHVQQPANVPTATTTSSSKGAATRL